MKKIILVGAILSTVLASAQQGIGTNLPDKSSALELRSTKRGLLIPRVPLQATNVESPVATPANSLLVYNTETAAAGTPEAVTPGYYYWNDTAKKWVRLVNDADLATVATEAATKSKETVSSANANIVEVTPSGGPLNKNYAVGIKPAGAGETKVLKSTNGTVEWGDAPAAAAATLNNITGTAKVVADIDVSTWGAPGDVFLCVTTTTAAIDLPNPAQYAGKIIAVNNQANASAGYITNAPKNRSSLYPGHGHLLMSVGVQNGGSTTYGWYIIGGSY